MGKFFILSFFTFSLLFSQNKQEIDSLHQLYTTYKNKDLAKALKYANEAVLLSKKNITKYLIFKSYNNYIEVLYKQKKDSLALKNAIILHNLVSKNDNRQLCLSYLHLANIYIRQQKYNKGLVNIEKGLSIAQVKKFTRLEHQLLNSKVVLLDETENKDKALHILKEIIKKKTWNNTTNLGETYNYLGALYFKFLNKKDSSAYFYKKGISIVKNNAYLKTNLYVNLGDLLLQTDSIQKGVHYLLQAKKIAVKNNNFRVLYYISSSLGIYHNKKREYKNAIIKYKEAEKLYGKYTEKSSIAHLYWMLSGALYFDKQYKEGFEYQDKLILLKDSLFTIEKNKTFEKLQTEYQVEKKNNQIQLLEKEKELEAQRKKLVYGIGGLLLLILGLLAFVYRYKVQAQKRIQAQNKKLHQQEKEQLEQAQKIKHIEGFIRGEEKEKNRIAIELHDGIGGKLAGVKHFVSSLAKTDETVVLSKNIGDITKEVRLLSHSLSYNYSLQQPLQNLLEELKEQYKNHFLVEVILYPENEIDAIAGEKKLFLYRTIQELVNNAYKYAHANTLTISITLTNELLLLVEDNGIGFNIDATPKGIGLQNIKEKLLKFKGELHIDTTPHKGTTVIVKLPK